MSNSHKTEITFFLEQQHLGGKETFILEGTFANNLEYLSPNLLATELTMYGVDPIP